LKLSKNFSELTSIFKKDNMKDFFRNFIQDNLNVKIDEENPANIRLPASWFIHEDEPFKLKKFHN